MVEASFIVTVVLSFLFGVITLGSLFVTSYIAGDVMRTAARAALRTSPQLCLAPFLQELTTAASENPVSFDMAQITSQRSVLPQGGAYLTFMGYALAPCPLCPILTLGSSTRYRLRTRATVYVASQEVCQDVP
jgi:hypothetical protein